ncbi:myocardin-related transcription factor B isoform X2 [Armigeres subalbatus]
MHSSMEQTNQGFTMDCTNPSRISPPKSTIDSTPLQPAMDKNKESLKVKLLVRRSLNQLVEQGIMPSPKTSPAIYEQQRQLERAKTGDMLKAKIKQRPDRMELERRHILEHQEGNIDPSLAEKKRMLEKALLVDHLNSKISHRPGPLELIEKNILHAEEPIERIVKEGLVNYTSTDEAVSPAQTLRSPESMVCIEDDSLSSEGETQNLQRLTPINVLLLTQPQSTTVSTDALIGTFSVGVGTTNVLETASSSDTTKFARPETCVKKEGIEPVPFNVVECIKKPYVGSSATSSKSDLKEKSKKKNKNKVISKTRSIKFHEYKGPPNAQKHASSLHNSGETNYQLIMKQQYLLEYLEEICKHPPAASSSSSMSFSVTAREKDGNTVTLGGDSQKLPPDPATETLNKLKVFQLKRYCKKYNLPVSGSKSSLIDRLKPFLPLMEQTSDFEGKTESDISLNSNPASEAKATEGVDEQVLKEQQKRIAELQMLLKKSQDELEHMKMIQQRSPQDFNQIASSSSDNLEQISEPETTKIFKSEEINITSLHTDKILSDMDIKITVRIDTDSPDSTIKPKLEPNFTGKDTMLSVLDGPSSILNTNAAKQWKTDALLDAVVEEEHMLQCDAIPHRTVSFPSNTETLDKLLGQVQPGIPNLNDSKDQVYKMPLDTNAQSDMLSNKDMDTKSMSAEPMHTPLVLNDYNDVDLLDFHMQIDDTSDNYAIPKSIDSAFPSMDIKEPDCNTVNSNKMNYESVTSDSSLIYNGDDDKTNAFNDFDGMRFVHNGPYSELFKLHHTGMNVIQNPTVDPESYLKMNQTNDINDNFTNIPASHDLSCSFAPKHLDLSSSSEASNVKRCWMPNSTFYDGSKLKMVALDNQHHGLQSNQNHSDIINIAGMKNSDDRYSFGDHNKDTLLNSTCNNSTHTGHISPMDFDSLLSNMNSPLTPQNCDRGVLDENQDKALYDLQQNNLLDYFTDDYGMHNAII